MTKEHQMWFKTWFNTPYYHILYKNRDYKEAELFIKNLVRYLNLDPTKDSILDLACGQGRHSIYLNSLGFEVTGIDLSNNSIQKANENASESLKFEVHDMRNTYNYQFEIALNLFTSLGYFKDEPDNLKVIKTIKSSLKSNGIGVIDFMNSPKVIKNLVAHSTHEEDHISFSLNRDYTDGFINKSIEVDDNGQIFKYNEMVRAYNFEDFSSMLSIAGLHLLDCFGSYKLEPYNSNTSDRLILIFINND
jgi:SAM-dependent methyltransferase